MTHSGNEPRADMFLPERLLAFPLCFVGEINRSMAILSRRLADLINQALKAS